MRVAHNKTHGMRNTREYEIWKAMRRRCNSPTSHAYERYGGRGIKVCERWNKFENFLLDIGPRPSPAHSLDRIDNDKGYEPANVHWATPAEQSRNTRRNHWITYKGERLVLEDWAKKVGIHETVLLWRLKKKWSIERALTQKPNRGSRPSK